MPAILVLAVVLAYANALGGAFQFDDYCVIVDNPAVHSLAAWASGPLGIRPLLKVSYTLNWILGPGPFGFHLCNLAIHATNTVLVWRLFRLFARETGALAALAGALLFALHPVQTEAVTYICGRSSSLMACFYLGALLAYARGRASGDWIWQHAISGGLFILAFLVKETAVTLPAALVLWECTVPPGPARRRAWLGGPWAHWVILAGLMALMAGNGSFAKLVSYALGIRGTGVNLLSQINAVTSLLGQFLWPARLNIDPALPVLTRWTPALAAKAYLLAALVGVGLASLRSRPWLAFGILWFFLHLLPTNSVVPRLDLGNERQLYLAGAGVAFAGVTALGRLGLDRRWATLGLPVLAALAMATTMRNRDYRSEVGLWQSSIRVEPGNARAYNNLGWALWRAGDRRRARMAFHKALALKPDDQRARINLERLTQAPSVRVPVSPAGSGQ